MKLRWSQRAATQLFEAADDLEGERPGTGDRLYTAVDRLVALIKEHPWAFPREPHQERNDVRHALELRYNDWIVYRIVGNDAEILVLTFWPTRRHPKGWLRGQ